jgi:secondary thiamine-phosphate synthase enzyme
MHEATGTKAESIAASTGAVDRQREGMLVYHETFQIESDSRPTFQDVTVRVGEVLTRSRVTHGMLLVYSQHTTCSVLLQEASHDVDYNGTEFLMRDLVTVLEGLIPTCRTEGQYRHPGPKHIEVATTQLHEEAAWSLNTDAHLRSVLLGRSQSVPVVDGRMVLGEFGRFYFADFDQTRARERTVWVQIMGE